MMKLTRDSWLSLRQVACLVAVAYVLGVPVVALGQSLDFVEHGMTISAVSGTITENGTGRPTVTYDPVQDLYVMLFDVHLPTGYYDAEDYAGCDFGVVWGIARATSNDGLNWVVDETPAILPDPTSAWPCIVVVPTAFYDGTTHHVWFVGAAPLTNPEGDSALSYATSQDGQTFEVQNPATIVESGLGVPSVMKIDDEYLLLLDQKLPDSSSPRRIRAGSSPDGSSWTLNPTDGPWALAGGGADWAADEVYSPALTCNEDSPNERFFEVFFGGFANLNNNPVGPRGVAFTLTDNFFAEWPSATSAIWMWDDEFCDADYCFAEDDPVWRSFDVLAVGDAYLLYVSSRPAAGGLSEIGLWYSTEDSSWDEATIRNRTCTLPSADSADLAITKTDGQTVAVPGGTTTYTIVVSNAGPSAVTDALVVDSFPADLTCDYTSVAIAGASGNTESGSGDINDSLILPAGSSVTYSAACDIALEASGTMLNTATVSSALDDSNPGNESETDTTIISTEIFLIDGMESDP